MSVFADWTTAEKTAFRKELGKAIASGAMRVRFADREVSYRSLEDMRQASKMLDDELAAAAGTRRARRLTVMSQKGF